MMQCFLERPFQAPSRAKEIAVPHFYTIIKVARDEDFLEQIGKDIYFDLVDHEKVPCFRVENQMLFSLFKDKVAKDFGIPAQYQRFWLWAKRGNQTYRPLRPLIPHEEALSVGQLREETNKEKNSELKLFLEVPVGPNLRLIPPPEKTEEKILLFFKLYDPFKEELRYIGRMFVEASGMPTVILDKLNEMAGFAHDEEIELFEEINFEPNVMCVHIDKEVNFVSSEIEDGDIICFQKSHKGQHVEQRRNPDVPSFLKHVHNLQVLRSLSLEKPKDEVLP